MQVKVTCQRGCFVRFSYASTTKDGKKCTNTPMRCTAEGCDAVIWKYNMCAHWRSAHGGKPAPAALRTGPLEGKYMLKLVRKLKKKRGVSSSDAGGISSGTSDGGEESAGSESGGD